MIKLRHILGVLLQPTFQFWYIFWDISHYLASRGKINPIVLLSTFHVCNKPVSKAERVNFFLQHVKTCLLDIGQQRVVCQTKLVSDKTCLRQNLCQTKLVSDKTCLRQTLCQTKLVSSNLAACFNSIALQLLKW